MRDRWNVDEFNFRLPGSVVVRCGGCRLPAVVRQLPGLRYAAGVHGVERFEATLRRGWIANGSWPHSNGNGQLYGLDAIVRIRRTIRPSLATPKRHRPVTLPPSRCPDPTRYPLPCERARPLCRAGR